MQYTQTMDDGSTGTERFRMTFDPDTSYGRDLYIELEGEPPRSAKQYRRMLEVSMGADYWLRKEDHIYLSKSIAWNSSAAQEVIASMGGKLNSGELALLDTADDKLTDSVVAALGMDTETSSGGDVVRLDLQRSLPFYADEVRKLGFELPKTYGLGVALHYQVADIDMQACSIWIPTALLRAELIWTIAAIAA